MLLALTDEQEFFRETTQRYLAERVPPDSLRAMRDDPMGFEAAYWRQGADLGWTSLLVSEERGGGSISGAGLVDLGLIAYEFGRSAAPGPLVGSSLVAMILSDAGSAEPLLKGLLAGEATGAWCDLEWMQATPAGTGAPLRLELDDAGAILSGTLTPVEYAATASAFVVCATDQDGLVAQVLVPATAAGLQVTPIGAVDLTRRYATVSLERVRVAGSDVLGRGPGALASIERQQNVALVLDAIESLGAMDAAFAMTQQWLSDRYSFGRPLASYQALKHRMADMKAWVEAGHALCGAALLAAAGGEPGALSLASAATAFVGQYGSELMHECVQMHGGIGLTFEHDLHLYLRRHTVIRALRGTPTQHHQHLARLIGEGKEAQ
jgi:alkylation response protein AidB-like acyl-CoA dehydrogenase